MTGVANLTDASLNDRLHQSCDFLAEILAGLLRAKVPGPCLRWPSRALRISDGSCISKPGSKGTDWRVQAKRARKRFFEHIRSITDYLVFPDWRTLMTTLINSKPSPEIEKQIAG